MLPRIASLGQLSSALSRANGFAPKGKQVQGRRTSIDRRSCSVQDLVGLDVDQVASSSRPVTPCPLGAITESQPAYTLVEAAADDTLAYLDSLQQLAAPADANADLSVHLQICSPWDAVVPHAQSESAAAGAELHLAPGAKPSPKAVPVNPVAAVEIAALASVQQQAVEQQQATLPAHEQILSHSITISRASSISSSSTLPPATPSAEPAPGEVRVYRSQLSLTCVKELLNNLAHVQTLMRTAASQGTQAAAASAAGAARMISRSLPRVATRVRNAAKGGAGEVLLSPEALFTLTEYGWAEVTTLDEACAEELKVVEMECYDLARGRSVLYTRVSADQPWLQVGHGPTNISSVLQALGGAVHPVLHAAVNALGGQGDVLGPALGRHLAAAGRGGASGYPPTLAHLADQLVSAGEAVLDAVMHLDQWIKEVSGVGGSSNGGGVPATPLAAGAAFSTPAHNNTGLAVVPVMVTAGGV